MVTVHFTVALVPATTPVMVVVGEFGVVIGAIPLTNDQSPVPADGAGGRGRPRLGGSRAGDRAPDTVETVATNRCVEESVAGGALSVGRSRTKGDGLNEEFATSVTRNVDRRVGGRFSVCHEAR